MLCPTISQVQSTIMRMVNASPIVLLILILTWSYYAYNVSLCYGLIKDGHTLQGILYMLFYHPLFVLCLWSYWTVCETSPGYTMDMYKKRDEEQEDVVGLLADTEEQYKLQQTNTNEPMYPSITVKRDGAKRFCQKCQLEKFDRTHHCRQCKRCVLKMDHHCPWINNCVGFRNYKAFYLFLFYASLYCIYVFSTTLPYCIVQANGPMSILGLSIHWALLVFISGVFGVFLIPFTLFHTRQLCKNRTTIEFYEKSNFRLGTRDVMRSKYFNPWDIGTRKNIEQVFGKDMVLWFIPVPSQIHHDGLSFPINTYAYDTLGAEEDEEEEQEEE
ncbi:DHHC palmitoyltransferase-domain-containing protein [Gilbertella persicaria]|uniref:DHHC palmitoyltransferase-domain-containing protein n=1 Tax=Gilbertella persicaria TaxID=101096 RepID=UPI002220829A|nr:DHHC palmitoyltransferase-domain-containing protein [Gilbertella persicaria]KAI8048338.1 DHHC palmitoyltransferase-domain-containing protein [Gilbertella persicaria]